MDALLHRHPLEEEGEERQAGAAHADRVRRHPAPEQSSRRVPIHAALDIQQGVALVVVLPQERRRCPSVGVHQVPDRRGPRAVEEVGRPREGQEEDLRPHHRHPYPEGERPEGVMSHRGLPRKEGGAIDDARAPAIRDGARGVVQWNGAR